MSPRGEIASPCVSICQIDRATGVCGGCRRTLQEIATWLQFTDAERRRIMADLPHRKMGARPGVA
jgi:predicted Fe-S protein YdhL (DUF1289 family)